MNDKESRQKVGRPRAISVNLVPVLRELRAKGFGYKRCATILRNDYGISLHWTRIRDFVKGRSCYSEPEYQEK